MLKRPAFIMRFMVFIGLKPTATKTAVLDNTPENNWNAFEREILEKAEELARTLPNTSPKCLKNYISLQAELPRYAPLESDTHNPSKWIHKDENTRSVWNLSCTCGSAQYTFFGHVLPPSPDENAKIEDEKEQESEDEPLLISPLALECNACGKTTVLLDTDQHGYHAEIGDTGVKLRATGPQIRYSCPKCDMQSFRIQTVFIYWNLDEISETVLEDALSAEDLFNVFLCFCQCVSCGHLSEPIDLGKL